MSDDRMRGARRVTRPTRVWVRVRDTSTGHQYDVQEVAVREGMEVLTDQGKHTGLRPRPTKHYTDLAGNPAKYRPNAPAVPPETQTDPAPAVADNPTARKGDKA